MCQLKDNNLHNYPNANEAGLVSQHALCASKPMVPAGVSIESQSHTGQLMKTLLVTILSKFGSESQASQPPFLHQQSQCAQQAKHAQQADCCTVQGTP